MRARLAWFTALSSWLLATACTDDGGPKQRDMDADPSTSPEPEAGVAPDSEADAQQDASPVAPPALADQTPPTSANGLAFDAAGMLWLADLRGGQVLLWGSVASEHERSLAGEIASRLTGRTAVINHIQVFRTTQS